MSFINNPLGSGGTSYQGLGNLTAGIEALQRTEVQRRIGEIEQDKANKRSDALRNEEFALKMASTDVINDRRVAIAEQAAKDAESFMQANADLVKKAQSEGRGLTLSEKMKIMTDQKKILQNNAQAANFTDALEKAQSIHISTLKTLKDPVSKEQYNKQWADLYQRMKDPVLSKDLSPSDIIAAVEPPPPPFSVLLQEKAKQLLPFVDSSVKSIGGGRTEVDRDKLMTAIKANVSIEDPLYTQGVSENRLQTPDQMYSQIAEILAPSIKTDVVGWKPNEPTEKEKFEGIIGRAKAVDVSGKTPNYVSDRAYISTNWGTPISITTKEGIGEFTPKQSFPNGMVQGTVKVAREVPSKERDYNDVEEDQANQAGSRIEVTQTDAKGNPTKAKLITKSVIERTEEVPWTEYGEVLGKRDPNMKKYFESEGVGIAAQKKTDIPMKRSSKSTNSSEVQRQTKDGKIAIFDATTKKFLRYAE